MNPDERQSTAAALDAKFGWEILKGLGVSEPQFNSLETEYRKLASIWLVASFAGTGFLLRNDPRMAIPRDLAIGGIGLAASLGILLLWIADMLVYHRLLDPCFSEANRIEAPFPELPQVRTQMGRSQAAGGRVVTTRLRWFYMALSAAPLVFSSPFVAIWSARVRGAGMALLVISTALAYVALTSSLIWRKSLRSLACEEPRT